MSDNVFIYDPVEWEDKIKLYMYLWEDGAKECIALLNILFSDNQEIVLKFSQIMKLFNILSIEEPLTGHWKRDDGAYETKTWTFHYNGICFQKLYFATAMGECPSTSYDWKRIHICTCSDSGGDSDDDGDDEDIYDSDSNSGSYLIKEQTRDVKDLVIEKLHEISKAVNSDRGYYCEMKDYYERSDKLRETLARHKICVSCGNFEDLPSSNKSVCNCCVSRCVLCRKFKYPWITESDANQKCTCTESLSCDNCCYCTKEQQFYIAQEVEDYALSQTMTPLVIQ